MGVLERNASLPYRSNYPPQAYDEWGNPLLIVPSEVACERCGGPCRGER